jgi:ParB/Sulfiredoxin domain
VSDKVQKNAFEMFEITQIGQIGGLVDSIKSNGYIPSEVIVVKPYKFDASKYVIIEGNRRLTAIRQIIQNSLDPNNDELAQSLQELDVLVYNPTEDEQQNRINERILQGIRHISGPKAWGAYQQAHLIVQLHDEAGQSWSDIGKRLGLGTRQVTRYYRAYKALRQMKDSEEFGQKARSDLFSLFDEALKSNSIREWLRWQDNLMCFTDYQRTYIFYSLLVGDPENPQNARLTNPQDMRHFSEVLMSGKSDVLARFLEGILEVDTAARLTKPEPLNILLKDSLLSFIDTLAKFPAEQLSQVGEEELALFERITQKIDNLRKLREAYIRVESNE